MKFICPEVIKQNLSEYIRELFTKDSLNQSFKNVEGVAFNNAFEIKTINNKPVYFFGNNKMKYLFNTYEYDDTYKTISTLESDMNTPITNYTDLDTETFKFQFQNLIDTKKPFKTSLWWSIFTDEGIVFTKPKINKDSVQLTNFDVISENIKNDDYFGNVNYVGETTGEILISANVDFVVPETLGNTEKAMVLNKYKSSNNVIIIHSNYSAKPLDYVPYKNNFYIIMNKKELITKNEPVYEYICIRQFNETYTFGGDDLTPPIHPLIGTSAGGGGSTTNIRCTKSSAQTVNFNSTTVIQWNNKTYDTLNEMDVSSTFRFTPLNTGYYRIAGRILFNNASWGAGKHAYMRLYKNGASYSEGDRKDCIATYTRYLHISMDDTIYLTVGDYIDVRVYHTESASKSILGSAVWNYLSINRI